MANLPASSPVQVMDWRSRLAQGNTTAQTRQVTPEETVAHQLNRLTASGSQYLTQAQDRARNEAAARGMMMSSTAVGAGTRAAIDAGLPIASQDATTYGRTASENMAATNADRLADQQMWGQLTGQEVGIRANLDESERARGFTANENLTQRTWQTGERLGSQQFQTGERIGAQQFQTSERLGTQAFTTSERLGTQQFTAQQTARQQAWQGAQNDAQRLHEQSLEEARIAHDAAMRLLDRNAATTQQDKQLFQQRFLEFQSAMNNQNAMLSQAISSIFNNPNLTAAQQLAAVQNARATYQSMFNSWAQAMSAGVPQIYANPYTMPQAAGQQVVSTGGNTPATPVYTLPPISTGTPAPTPVTGTTGGSTAPWRNILSNMR